MKMSIKLQARAKLIDAITALPTQEARRKWAYILGTQLYKMQKDEK